MKQTAVEWFFNELYSIRKTIEFEQQTDAILKAFEQAKAMEKEQIIESWDNGYANGYDLGKHDDEPNPDDAEQYYNETFKSE